jgi:MYXO-CTERM domain-containing protein
MKMKFSVAALRVLALIGATAWSLPSRADIAPTCDSLDALITCEAKDVGKACQGGGQCYAETCGNLAAGMTIYKCDVCATVVSAPDGGCDHTPPGTACGDGGTCAHLQSFCTSTGGYACVAPSTAQPSGPPAGESGGTAGSGAGGSTGAAGNGGAGGSSGGTGGAVCPSCKSSGGCDVSPRAAGPGAIALGLLVIGALAFLYDRRRKRRL